MCVDYSKQFTCTGLHSFTPTSTRWGSEAKCHPGLAAKVPLIPSLKFAYKNLKGKRIMFVLGKDMRNILDIRIKHSQIEIGLVFHSRSWVVLFCFFATFLIIFLSCFFFPSLHMHLWSQHISLYFLQYWFSVCGKPHHLALIVYRSTAAYPTEVHCWAKRQVMLLMRATH